MKDNEKTREALIAENEALRAQIEELESKIDTMTGNDDLDLQVVSRMERKNIHTSIEFITDFDIVEARGINISSGGISFEVFEELPFEIRFEHDGIPHHHRANLVWMKRIPAGGYRFGLMFTRPRTPNRF